MRTVIYLVETINFFAYENKLAPNVQYTHRHFLFHFQHAWTPPFVFICFVPSAVVLRTTS